MIERDHYTVVPMTTDEERDAKGYVHWKSWHETYAGLIPADYLAKTTLEKCVQMAHRWPQNTLLLKCGGDVIGFACYGTCADGDLPDTGELIAIYLLGEYQGQKLGLSLMQAAMEKLTDKRRVALWVLKGNGKAIHFYERYGFRFDGTEKVLPLGTEMRMVWEKK